MPELPGTGSHRTGQVPGLGNQAKVVTAQWPTPVANDDNKSPEAHMAMKARMKGGERYTITSLNVLTKMWSAPDVSSGARDMSKIDPQAQKCADTKRTTGIATEARMWMTPKAGAVGMTSTTSDRAPEKATALQADYLHQAPATTDGQTSSSEAHGTAQPLPLMESDPPPKNSARLNPYFVEKLMGWPLGWTSHTAPSASRHAGMESWRSRHQLALSQLLGEPESSQSPRRADVSSY
jgi:hypothetical protein